MSFPLSFPVDDDEDDSDEGGSPSEVNSDATMAYSMGECEEEDTAAGSQDSAPLPVQLKELHFWYIDLDGREVCSKDLAAVTINGKYQSQMLW